MKYTITLFFLQLLTYSYGQNDIRYISKIFNDYNLYQNITYEEAIPYNIEGIKAIKSYKLDFYEPFGDDVSSRPLVLLFPDGNFIAGNKEQDEIVNWCRTLTTYGYTCACVNYRQGYDNTIPKDGINQATFRAVQDGRAAIRFFIEHQDAFRINTDKIFLGGYKTGAEVALQTAFIDKEEEYPNWLGCLDCSGNPFYHNFSVAGVVNIDGVLDNQEIVSNNSNISVLNIQVNQLNKNIQTADLTDDFKTPAVEAFHQYLVGLNFQSHFECYEPEVTSIESFANKTNYSNINTVVNFFGNDLVFQTNSPLGDSDVCENTVATYYYEENKNSSYEWVVENGTIEGRTKNSVSVRWNKGRGIGKVKAIRTDLETGTRGEISNPLNVEITSAPIADFEMEYLSSNCIKITDKSFAGNLFSIDYDFEGQMYQGNPNTNVLFSYTKDGQYNLIQTVENICGFATQIIPVEITLSKQFQATKIEKVVQTIPFLINQGNNITLDVSDLSNLDIFTIVIKNDFNKIMVENKYAIQSIINGNLSLGTTNLEEGTYFIEFFADETLVMTKSIRVK
jgi:alpha/beta superfamily hydrolase